MKRIYLCPHCKAVLNPSTKIVLRAQSNGRTGLFLFSPRPGNYEVVIPDGFGLRPEDSVMFSCPVCSCDLTSAHDPALAEIRFSSRGGSTGTVAFSRVFGRHASYFITAERVRSYGEHALDRSLNFWGEGREH